MSSMINMSKALAPQPVHLLFACVALLSCLRAAPACAKSAHVLIIVPPGATAPAGFAHQLARWRQSGVVSSAQLTYTQQNRDPVTTCRRLYIFSMFARHG